MKNYILLLICLYSTVALSQEKTTYDIGVLVDFQTEELAPPF